MQRLKPILIAAGVALVISGCAGQAGGSSYAQRGSGSDDEDNSTPGGMQKKPRDAALLRPGEARPGLLHIRREGGNYTLELLLDTSSVNTVYDIELPEKRD
jgi:hypothetical protein